MEIALTLNEAAKRAGIGRSTLYEAVGRGELRIKKAGRRSLIISEELKAWIDALPDASLVKPRAA